MAVLHGELPVIGDLVLLPHWAAPNDAWFRVLGARPDDRWPGWCRLDGYVIMPDGRQRLCQPQVPVADLVLQRV